MNSLLTGTAPASFVAVSVALTPWDPLEVARVLGAPTLFWDQREQGLAAVGVGVATERAGAAGELQDVLDQVGRTQLELLDAGGGPLEVGPWFGGFAFDPSQSPDEVWNGFPATRWVLPALLFVRQGERASLFAFERVVAGAGSGSSFGAATEKARERAEAAQAQLTAEASPAGYQVGAPVGFTVEEGGRDAWESLMRRALAQIERGGLKKVVLARGLNVLAEQPLPVLDVLARARQGSSLATVFMLAEPGGGYFIGATPELLCEVSGTELKTQALASTAAPKDKGALALEDKERREHQSVVESIREALAPLSSRLNVRAEPQLLELSYASHLCTPVEVTLRPGVSATAAVLALHPTSAVGGTPRSEALAFLREREGLSRGWYTGAVGWMGPGRVRLNVALRSAVLRGNRARLFVGAGVVKGSTAEREWAETRLKSRPMRMALGESSHD